MIRRTSHYSRLAEELALGAETHALDEEEIARCYRQLLRIRRAGEEIIARYPADRIKSPVHLSIGQEAVSVSVCAHLKPADAVFATYRGHAAYLAKGGDPKAMWAELYGKVGGCGRGKAGSMHLADASVNMMGTSAIVASAIPDAVGYALAVKMRGEERIVACFFGEGAADEGVTSESINFAALHRLPVLFVCENNEYAVYSHVSGRMAGYGIGDRYRAYGIACDKEDSGSFVKMHEAAGHAVEEVRKGHGPRLIEIKTMRWRDHVGPGEDLHFGYRSEDALYQAMADDQLEQVGLMLTEDDRRAIAFAVKTELEEAIAFAELSEFPDDKEVHDHVFAARA